jgi:Glyoxalase-like domain
LMTVLPGPGETSVPAMLARRLDARGDHFLGWAVRTDDVQREALRLKRTPQAGGGQTVRWRTVRPRTAAADHLPFFIEYDGAGATRYLQTRYDETNSPARPGGFAWIELTSPPSVLGEWLGAHDLPIRFANGDRGVQAVGINTDARGEIVIRVR